MCLWKRCVYFLCGKFPRVGFDPVIFSPALCHAVAHILELYLDENQTKLENQRLS